MTKLPYDALHEGNPGGGFQTKRRDGVGDNPGGTIITGPAHELGGIKINPGVLGSTGHVGQTLEEREVKAGGRPGAPAQYVDMRPDRPIVEPTTINVDAFGKPLPGAPARNMGYNIFDRNAHPVGTKTQIQPWYNLETEIGMHGVRDLQRMAVVVQMHGSKGSFMPERIRRKLSSLASFGDHDATKLLNYAHQVEQHVRSQQGR